MRATLSLLALAATAVLGLSACTSGDGGDEGPTSQDPPVSAFREGACRTTAPAVLDAGARVRDLAQEPPAPELLQQLADAQAALTPLPEAQELVAGIGFVRLRTASGTWTPDVGDSLRATYQGLITACTGPADSPAPAVS